MPQKLPKNFYTLCCEFVEQIHPKFLTPPLTIDSGNLSPFSSNPYVTQPSLFRIHVLYLKSLVRVWDVSVNCENMIFDIIFEILWIFCVLVTLNHKKNFTPVLHLYRFFTSIFNASFTICYILLLHLMNPLSQK